MFECRVSICHDRRITGVLLGLPMTASVIHWSARRTPETLRFSPQFKNPRRDEFSNFALGALPGGQDHGYQRQHQTLF